MEWLIVGLGFGVAGCMFAFWARTKNIRIQWSAWTCIVLAVLVFALMVMDFRTLTIGQEPTAAQAVLWLYGIPSLVLALIAVGLIWWQNRKTISTPTES